MEPKNKEPVSPKKTLLFLLKLNTKNPTRAPIMIGKNKKRVGSEISTIPPATKKT